MTARVAGTARREQGFTLLELIVVLAIVSLVAVALAPIANPWRQGGTIDVAAREVVIGLRAARTAAIHTNREATVTFDAAAGEYWSDASPSHRALPAQITVGLGSGESSVGQVRFFPDGGASGGTIVLKEAHRSAVIKVDAMSGKATFHVGP
jgi:general secretion pathway protein H